MLNRRQVMQGAAAVGVALHSGVAAATTGPEPIVFLHGDSDQASIWQKVIWRFESNGYPADLLFPIDFINPKARDDNTKPQANRSSTDDELKQITAYVAMVLAKTGASKVVMVASSRGGYAIRNYLAQPGNAAHVSKAILCGTPNHGVFAIPALLGSEYNGMGAFLKGLNGGASEVVAGVDFMTLRSDGNDKYAQPDGRFLGHPGMKTNITSEGPALKGALNLVLPGVDHRGTAFTPQAFREQFKFITGREPAFIGITPEAEVTLNGRVTGMVGDVPTNLPVAGAKVDIYRVSPITGERVGVALLTKTTAADGIWGPLKVDSKSALEFVIAAPGQFITHIYKPPIPRSFDKLNLRPAPAAVKADAGAAAVLIMSCPRGYFGLPRDIVIFDGKQPKDVTPGVPTDPKSTLRLADATARPVVAEWNEIRVVGRPWPAKDNHRVILEV